MGPEPTGGSKDDRGVGLELNLHRLEDPTILRVVGLLGRQNPRSEGIVFVFVTLQRP